MTAVPGARALLMQMADPVEGFRAAWGEDPLEWQVPYLRSVHNAVLLKGRQVGASTATSMLGVRWCRLIPDCLVAVVSPSLKQSTEVTVKARRGFTRLGEELKQDSASMIQLANGSRFMSLPGSAKSVRGWTADLLVIDEAAFLDPETFLAARATVATGGRIVVQSTPTGPFGPFYDLYVSDEPGWAKFRVPSVGQRTISPEFLASERATLSEAQFAQEYLAEWSSPGLGLVDPERLAALTQEALPEGSPWAALR